MVCTLMLSVVTGFSASAGKLVDGYQVERSRSIANEILSLSAEELNPSNFSFLKDFTSQQTEQMLKLIIPNSLVELDFLDDETSKTVEEFLYVNRNECEMDYGFIYDAAYSNSIFGGGNFSSAKADDLFKCLFETLRQVMFYDRFGNSVQHNTISTENSELEEEDNKKQEIDKEDDTNLIPIIKEHDNSQVSVDVNKIVDDCKFIGFDFSAPTCMTFYNLVSDWLNKKAMMTTIGTTAIWKTVVSLIRTNPLSSALYGKLYSLISSVWASFMKFFMTGTIGLIAAIIVSIAALGTLAIVLSVYIAGLNGKGWRIGLLIHNWHSWEWICDTY